jgi:hypothetical protein
VEIVHVELADEGLITVVAEVLGEQFPFEPLNVLDDEGGARFTPMYNFGVILVL